MKTVPFECKCGIKIELYENCAQCPACGRDTKLELVLTQRKIKQIESGKKTDIWPFLKTEDKN